MTAHDELVKRIRRTQADCPDSLAAADAIEQLQRDLAFQKEVTDAARQTQAELLERAGGLERDAARYRWLRDNCFDWAAPGDGDSFDYIALHFEHELLGRDDSTVDAAIDAAMAQKEPT